ADIDIELHEIDQKGGRGVILEINRLGCGFAHFDTLNERRERRRARGVSRWSHHNALQGADLRKTRAQTKRAARRPPFVALRAFSAVCAPSKDRAAPDPAMRDCRARA